MRARDWRTTSSIMGKLHVSLELREVFEHAMPDILAFCGADYGALWAPDPERPHQNVWSPCFLPPDFLEQSAYEQMREYDFVYAAVSSKPGIVLCDSEMIDRPSFEQNSFYRRALGVGAPIENVMAVMPHYGDDYQCGLSLYRACRKPFRHTDRDKLQELTPSVARAVGNCVRHAEALRERGRIERFLDERAAVILFSRPPLREIDRTFAAVELLDTWCPSKHRDANGLPSTLLQALSKAQAAWEHGERIPWDWQCGDTGLKATFRRLPEGLGDAAWRVTLREMPHIPQQLPSDWRRLLAPKEQNVCIHVLAGWDYEQIAGLQPGKSPGTVKKQVENICEKLGVADRKELQAVALRYHC